MKERDSNLRASDCKMSKLEELHSRIIDKKRIKDVSVTHQTVDEICCFVLPRLNKN